MGPHSITSSSHHLSKSLVWPANRNSPTAHKDTVTSGCGQGLNCGRRTISPAEPKWTMYRDRSVCQPCRVPIRLVPKGRQRPNKFPDSTVQGGQLCRPARPRGTNSTRSPLPLRPAENMTLGAPEMARSTVTHDTVTARSRSLRCQPLQRPLCTPDSRKEIHNGKAQIAGRSARPRTTGYV